MEQILLNENISKTSNNVDNFIHVELSANEHLLPSDNIVKKVDEYQVYLKEKDESNKYRFIFTINPVCSNILFNANTEIVSNEGSSDCRVLLGNNNISANSYYQNYKYNSQSSKLTNYEAIRDTAYSHPDIDGLVYHCGVDIFNNHYLRKKEFKVVNKLKNSTTAGTFNTIFDLLRDKDGNQIKEKLPKGSSATAETSMHLYEYDSIMSFSKSVAENLIESDGWVGFINPITLDIPNYVTDTTAITINKCMNNNKAGEQIDMYPDRSLYSFIPKKNKYRNRIEKNWDYCITYPFENYTNEIVENNGVNGIKCYLVTELTAADFILESANTNFNVVFKSQIRHSLKKNDFINISFITSENTYETNNLVKIEDIGYENSDEEHYFKINFDSIFSILYGIGYNNLNNIEYRIRKNVNTLDCKYYFRRFKRLPNFNRSNVYTDDNYYISEEDIDRYAKSDFSSNINKMAYAENIYSDKIAQIVFNDDIVTSNIKDNLGRNLSELYLTIIKRNKGNEEWYENEHYGYENVEFSHCFGAISSGLDLSPDEDKYNVHKLTNTYTEDAGWSQSINSLEWNINEYGENDGCTFLGDIVEFSPALLKETTLEIVYHRFNTMQREFKSKNYKFGRIYYDTIKSDDYDYDSGFTTGKTQLFSDNINLQPEGYYYQPHYKIQIREFSDKVQQGNHTEISFYTESGETNSNQYKIITNLPNCLNSGDTLYIYEKNKSKRYIGTVISVGGKLYNNVTFESEDILSEFSSDTYTIFKLDMLMPNGAYDLNDGTGRYLWKEQLLSSEIRYGDELYNSTFTNGAHYSHKNINFFLRRQDPYGLYGLNGNVRVENNIDSFTGAATGKIKDISYSEYIESDDSKLC